MEMWTVAHLGLEKCLDVLELHVRVYLYEEAIAPVVDECDSHGYNRILFM